MLYYVLIIGKFLKSKYMKVNLNFKNNNNDLFWEFGT